LADACLIRPAAAIRAAHDTAHDTATLLAKVHKVNGLSFYAKMMRTLKAQPYLLKSIDEVNAAALLLDISNRDFVPSAESIDTAICPKQRALSMCFTALRRRREWIILCWLTESVLLGIAVALTWAPTNGYSLPHPIGNSNAQVTSLL
jgi:hypothetical protein